MSGAYTSSNMSAQTRVICERGKFFIETGTVDTFNKFLSLSAQRIRRDIPHTILQKIADLINQGDKDRAVVLWTQACQVADVKPPHRRRTLLFLISYLVVAGMALYAFLKVL
jgi:hypothetical protein